AYRVSGVQKFLDFNGSMSYFEQLAKVRQQDISDFLDNFVGLGLITAAEKADFLKGQFAGRASVFLELTFDDPAFTAMFIDQNGRPLGQETYDAFGRQCVAQLVQPGDEHDFRRIPMVAANDALW